MSVMLTFEKELESLVRRPTDLRPFVCNGSPLECSVFIVGFNPATKVCGDFWDHWRSGYGFDKEAWFQAYQEERLRRPLKPGKTRRSSVSNTRRVIEWIVESVGPIQCLETNIYSAATARAMDLMFDQRSMDPFDFLMKAIRPNIVVAHGNEAEIAVRERCIADPALVISVPHFSREWSEAKARALGRRIAEEWQSRS